MTGNTRRSCMERLVQVLRDRCELDAHSWFIDLGHGMGRPTMHIAALHPHVAGVRLGAYGPV